MTNAADQIHRLLRRNSRRLLKLYFPNGDEPAAGLLINHIEAHEQVSRDFHYVVTVLSDDPQIELTDVQGRMVCVELLREDGSSRYFNGLCFEFALLRVENSLAVYQMILRPWLALFRFRSNHCLFHNLSISDQTAQLFRETGLSRHEFRLSSFDPERTFSCQYDETDYNYLHRRWEEMGWHYWYEHTMQGHTLVISDASIMADPVDGPGSIAWHHAGGSNRDDKISNWSPRRQLVSGKVALSSFDFKRPTPERASNTSDNQQGPIHAAELYHYQDLYGFKNVADGEKIARRRMEQIDSESQVFAASSNHRAVQAGRWFSLKQDFAAQAFASKTLDNDFYIIEARHIADNNFLNAEGGDAHYENTLSCVPRKTPWRPALGFNSKHVKISGIDTALVVGPDGENIFTDGFGRVRVRFHWDREGNGSDSSAWIRVGTPWAGAEQGSIALPRIGSEVTVQWLGGSPDRPIIVGGVYNSAKMPPWDLPAQQSLTGLRSRELTPGGGNSGMGRSNHLILDDTHGNIQAQLKSDHQSSQLSLGHITRIDSNAGRKDFRGEGWEMTTNAWGVARAAKGMLLSTEPRYNAGAHTKDMDETTARLDRARILHEQQAKVAQELGAQEAKVHQSAIAKVLAQQHDEIKGSGGKFPELKKPHLVLASPAGIATSTDKSTHFASDEHMAFTTGKNFSIASGENMFASIRKTFRLLVHKAAMKLVSEKEDIHFQALANSINLLAKLNITHTANRIEFNAKEEVIINGGGSYIKYSGKGIEQGTTAKYVTHAAKHSLINGKSLAVNVPAPPEAKQEDEASAAAADQSDAETARLQRQENQAAQSGMAEKSSAGDAKGAPRAAAALPESKRPLLDPAVAKFSTDQQKIINATLDQQAQALNGKLAELKKWDKPAQEKFFNAFGQTAEAARQVVIKRVENLLDLNAATTVANFKVAEQGDRTDKQFADLNAAVAPGDPDHNIYLGPKFWQAAESGANSRLGILTHEMSHFLGTSSAIPHSVDAITGTIDGFIDPQTGLEAIDAVANAKKTVYGVNASRLLLSPEQALYHADTFEFYIEGTSSIRNH